MFPPKCIMCGDEVAEEVAGFLALHGLPPICSQGCGYLAAELRAVELKKMKRPNR